MAKLPSLSYVSVSMPTIPIAKSAYFVICMLGLHPYQNLCRSFVEIVHFDFLTETPLLLLCAFVPKTNHDNPYVHPRVRGDIVVVGIYTTSQMLVINWKTESCIILSFSSVCSLLANPSSHRLSTDSVRHCSCLWVYYHIRTRSPSGISRIGVIDIQSLAEYWMSKDSMEHWKSVAILDILPLASDSIHCQCYSGPGFRLSLEPISTLSSYSPARRHMTEINDRRPHRDSRIGSVISYMKSVCNCVEWYLANYIIRYTLLKYPELRLAQAAQSIPRAQSSQNPPHFPRRAGTTCRE